jgi:flagellar protein FliO/FliZ
MPRPPHEIRSDRRARVASSFARAVGASVLAAFAAAGPALADASGEPVRPSTGADAAAGAGVRDAGAGGSARSRPSRLAGLTWLRGDRGGTGTTGSDRWGAGTACLALVLAVCGGIAVAARRSGGRASAAPMRVIGRLTLSPKHSVYLLRVGRRTLVLGAGPQGPPALITELVDELREPPAPQREAES